MEQSDKFVVDICLRATDEFRNNARNDEVGNLAKNNEGNSNCCCLQIFIGTQELCPGLRLLKNFLQWSLSEDEDLLVIFRLIHAVSTNFRFPLLWL